MGPMLEDNLGSPNRHGNFPCANVSPHAIASNTVSGNTVSGNASVLPVNERNRTLAKSAEFDADLLTPSGCTDYHGIPAFGLLRHAANVVPNRTAVIYGTMTWTYEALNHEAVRAAALLQHLGVEPGDRVGVLLPNVPEFIIAVNGIWRAGGVVVALSPLMVPEEVSKVVRSTECKVVITLDMLAQLLGDCESELTKTLYVSIRPHLPALKQLGYLWARHQRTGQWSLPSNDRHAWFWESLNGLRREWHPVEIHPESDPAYILPTGGTTGVPKSVTLSHQNMVANAWQQFEWTHRSFGTETMIAVLPFFHSYGVSAMVLGGAAMAATLVLHHHFNARQVIQLIETHRPTVLHAVPAMLIALNERLRDYPADLSSIRWVISGGAPLAAEVGETFRQHSGALVVEGYGLSEASPVTHVGDLFGDPHYGTIGLPLPETECRIVAAEEGREDLGDDQVGELIVRGPQVMLGYWDDPTATAQTIRNGWLYTGDLATRTADGLYRIVGRKKDLIITSGFNVCPSEVEGVLRQVDDVRDAAVVGIADPRRGEAVKAFVVMDDKAEWNEDALREHCRIHLSKHKQPQVYEQCVGDLPRNFLGKVLRRKLRE
ncbi:Long-chain-fatty-acid--CoA ligase [Novipirellula galeiformis]|uniref:Long-chain-fatty-acid--CoA ligase n=1 Tax=Novipirellula galeiformis TaxID=2528004 RepID=A0A5C6CBY4_9BACT|nr:AMP-binding protein [Novipirellula galeiformis]TWU21545.1 Long-chain-fatty-acid--CoA ligase [Novipirellula galeiformis]